MRNPVLLMLLLFCQLFFGQNISSSKWRDLFSYNNVQVMKNDRDRIIAATENGLFYYYPTTGEVKKLSKANGLHQVKISAFDYNEYTQMGLVGYEDGSMDVITPDGVFLIIDIPLANGFTGSKRINHISINGDKAIVSVDYGVSIFDLVKREFGDTSFFYNGGNYEASNEAALIDNTIFAATKSGLKSHVINVNFPVYSTWNTVLNGNYTQLAAADNQLAVSDGSTVYMGSPSSLTKINTSFSGIKDMVLNKTNLVIIEEKQASVFDLNGQMTSTKNYIEKLNTGLIYNNGLYLGSMLEGILDGEKKSIKPDGPYNNSSYHIKLFDDQIWITSGKRGTWYQFFSSQLGYYHFNGSEWIYPDYFKNNPDNYQFNVLDLAVNPSNPDEVFFTNALPYRNEKGIFKMTDDKFSNLYNEQPTSYIKIPISLAFDEKNNLFSTSQYAILANGRGKNILVSYYNPSSNDFLELPEIISQGAENFLVKEGMMYITSPQQENGGMVLYQYNQTLPSGDDKVKILRTENNLPLSGTISCALDAYGDLWIGGMNGLRILNNPEEAVDKDQPQTDPIVITQSGIGEELFRDNKVLSIAVDSGNQKWISIDGGGVFYLSSDGQKTFEHFTKDNSPLPTNQVTDIKINSKTGEVFFATSDGVVAYKGDVAEITSEFGNIKIYPNPVVTVQYSGPVKITGLALKSNIRIVDAAGNLVNQAVASGGYYEWNLQNERGKRVASGVYYVLLTNGDGTDTATAKIAVVN